MAEFVFEQENSGTLVQVARGSKITIELRENPTTGYKWIPTSIDEAFLAPEGDVFLTGELARMGAGGVRQFFFRAKGAGHTTLRFTQKRFWESDEHAVDHFSLSIAISKIIPL